MTRTIALAAAPAFTAMRLVGYLTTIAVVICIAAGVQASASSASASAQVLVPYLSQKVPYYSSLSHCAGEVQLKGSIQDVYAVKYGNNLTLFWLTGYRLTLRDATEAELAEVASVGGTQFQTSVPHVEYITSFNIPSASREQFKRPFRYVVDTVFSHGKEPIADKYPPASKKVFEFDPVKLGFTNCRQIDLIGANDPPFAHNHTVTTAEDVWIDTELLSNDFDPDEDMLTITTTAPKLGVVLVNGATVTYTPNANTHGADSFNYTITDPSGLSSAAKVDITVTPVNDTPAAADDVATVDEDGEITINILANDTDIEGDALEVEAISTPANGVRKNQGNTVWYKPKKDFNGVDTFRYRVIDGKGGASGGNVTVTVNSVNDAPKAGNDAGATTAGAAVTINVLANDSDIDGDGLVIEAVSKPANGGARHDGKSVTYTPTAGFAGTDTFRYRISDGKDGKNHGDVTVTVSPP